MTGLAIGFSPRLYARICGALYLYIIGAGIFAEAFVRGRLIVPADASATAANLLTHGTLFRVGFSLELLHLAFDVAVAVLLYALLRPVDRNIALLAAFLRLASDVILAFASLGHLATLRLLGGANYLSVFEPAQLHSLALLAMKLQGDGYGISLVFFGFSCFTLGYLIFRSDFLPRTLGILLAIAGACYLINSFLTFVNPAFAARLFPAILLPALIAEVFLTLWLLVKAVNVEKWKAAAEES